MSKRQFTHLATLGTGFLAVLLHFVLIDAAVETFRSGSPVRWAVAAIVVGYTVLTVFARRLLGSAARIAGSVLVLLGLLALTAWLPDGTTRGIVLLGQSTSTILSAASTVAILLAGLTLIRWRVLPLVGRWVIALLTAYGVAAFVVGTIRGTPYPDLFHGGSLWELLPSMLQGAFVGALVLVPLALGLQAVAGRIRVRRGPAGRWGMETASLVTALVVAVAGVRPATAPSGALSVPFLPESVSDTKTTLQAARRLLERSGLRTADPTATAKAIGNDLAALVAFVRDRIAFDPYRGSLGGSLGALMARGGNAVDRSLLLSALLQAHGYRTRLVHGTLDEEGARRILEVARQRPQHPEERSLPVDEVARISGLPLREVTELQQAVDARGRELRRILKARVQRDEAFLQQRLQSAGIRLQPPRGPTVEDVRRHVWVQAEVEGVWRDLDPSVPVARLGQRLAEPEGELASDSLPEEWTQVLALRILVTYRDRETLQEHEVLKVRLRVPDLIGHVVALGFPPGDGQQEPETANAFLPVLLVGERQHVGSPIYLDAAKGRTDRSRGPLGPLAGRAAGVLERAWVELALEAPGLPILRIRRTLVEAPEGRKADADSAERARLQLVSMFHFVVAGGPFSTEWIAARQLDVLGNKNGNIVPFDLLALADAMARPHLSELAGNPQGIRRYYARPLIVAQRVRFRKASNGQMLYVKSVDIIHNRTEFMSADPLLGLRQGVLETHLERLLFEGLEVSNTTVVFERYRGGIETLSGDTKAADRLRIPAQAKAHIAEDLSSGYVVIVPRGVVQIRDQATVGWWRVRPDGGETLGRMEGGEGQTAVEKIILVAPGVMAMVSGWYCRKKGLTGGWCNPCWIALLGFIGLGVGFASVVYALMGEASFGLWFALRVGSGVGGGLNIGRCLDWAFPDTARYRERHQRAQPSPARP